MTGKRRAPKRVVVSGAGFMDVLKSANKFLRDTKILSQGATALANSGVLGPKGSAISGTVGSVAGELGYGRRRKRKH